MAMTTGSEDQIRLLIPAFRWLFGPFAVLAALATGSLFITSTRTDEFFAWTIAPPLTAALLGAAYAGALVLFVSALRQRVWANARIAVAPPFTLSTLILVATLMHLDRFHLDGAAVVPQTVAWIWLIVYLAVPPTLLVLAVIQLRAPGCDPPRVTPLGRWMRAVMAAYGGVGVLGGMVLFVVPERIAPYWPWTISALTGRVLAAWLTGLGVAALQAMWENDVRRLRGGFAAFGLIGMLGLVAVGRFADDIRWSNAGAVLLVAVLAFMVVAGVFAWLRGRTLEHPPDQAGSTPTMSASDLSDPGFDGGPHVSPGAEPDR